MAIHINTVGMHVHMYVDVGLLGYVMELFGSSLANKETIMQKQQ